MVKTEPILQSGKRGGYYETNKKLYAIFQK